MHRRGSAGVSQFTFERKSGAGITSRVNPSGSAAAQPAVSFVVLCEPVHKVAASDHGTRRHPLRQAQRSKGWWVGMASFFDGPAEARLKPAEVVMWNRFIGSRYAHLVTAIGLTLGLVLLY